MMRLTPIVQHLIIINVLVFFILTIANQGMLPLPASEIYPAEYGKSILTDYFSLWKSDLILNRPYTGLFKPIQILTSFFAHEEIFHILFNMLALASLGPPTEMVLRSKRFLRFYLFCGIVSGIALAFFDPSASPVLGASGAIFGVLTAFAIFYPTQRLSLFFLPPVEARKLVGIIAAVSFGLMLLQLTGRNIGFAGRLSHFGHLTGMGAAYLYFYAEKYLPIGRD